MENEMNTEEKQQARNTEMATTEKKQLKYQKLSFIMSVLRTIFMAAILAVVVMTAKEIVPKVNTLYASTMQSLKNIEDVTNELTQADLGGTVKNINNLTIQATSDLNDAMKQLNAVDIETLNNAIQNLNDTVEPLAEFLNKFSRYGL